ncbi:hypothetical protein ACNOYE_29715 [Nannocystaceae bacterium ST9]
MNARTRWLAIGLFTFGCGDDGTRDTATDDEIGSLGTLGSDEVNDESASSSAGESASESGSTSDSTETGSTSDSSESSTSDSSEGTSSDSTETGDPCEGMMQQPIEKLIWIANSGQGTVSKIDTETGVELGRYIVRPDSAGSPSRTSVNRYGDVAVANRNGGVTKVHASTLNCQDTNGTPDIQTSTDAQTLAWGQEECVAWHTPLAHADNRPVAWTNGTFNDQTCAWENLDVWTGWSDWAAGTAVVALLDGDDGSIIQEVPIPDLPNPWPGWFGFYGAAVDAEDNVWLTQLQGSNPQQSWLVRVRRDDFSYQGFPVPGDGGYGMTVTSDGYVWLCGLNTRRFNPQTEQWTSVPLLGGSVHTGGCMGDGEGLLYRGSYAQIHGIDTTTLEVVRTLDVGQVGDDFIWGVAVDFDGYVWGVPRNGSRAYKVDPDTNTITLQVDGLVQAYTYSDMTGFALLNVNPG